MAVNNEYTGDSIKVLKGLEAVRQKCREDIQLLTEDKAVRMRSYQTLGICAGVALAILFM